MPGDGVSDAVVSVAITRGPGRNGSTGGPTADTRSDRGSRASVAVRDAPANQPVTLNVGVESTGGGIGVDAMELSVEESGDYTLEVETADAPFSTTPDFATPGGAESLGHVRVGHSVPDSGIGDVTFNFRVAKERVGHDEPGQIALYRHHDGAWNELETTLVEETDESYVFAARSPGLSEFVVGKKRASFSITESRVELTSVADGTQLTVRVLVSNTGDAAGTYAADLRIEGRPVAHRAISIAPDGTRQLTYRHTVPAPGTYDVTVGSHEIGPVVVAEETTRSSSSELAMAANDQAGLGLGVFVGFVALVVASIFRD